MGASRPRQRDRPRGFTLLEVLVAFVILALTSAAVYRAVSGGVRGIEASATHTAIALHARSKLDEVGASLPVVSGTEEGTFADGAAWIVTIEPIRDPLGTGAGDHALTAFEVTVTVEADGRAITLTSVRLGRR